MMSYIAYIFFEILVFSFRLLPFRLLYIYSDILYVLLFKLIAYRKKVVFTNLRNSFPEKTEEDIHRIAKAFYKNLCDILLEGIKGMSMSKKSYEKRYRVINKELLNDYYKNGQNLLGVAGHYGNWEWGVVSFGFQFKHKSIALYKPLSNKYIDKFLKKTRSVWGLHLVPIKDTYRTFLKQHEKPALFFLVTDQNPSNIKKAIWVNFLNQDTACLHGAETYAKKFDLPLIFGDIQRVKRGHYTIEMSVLVEHPNLTEPEEITRRYMSKMEEIIRAKPQDWLWSHKRWKHKREQ